MADGTSSENGTIALLQGWTPWMRFVAFVGVPSAIAMFLVWRLDGRSTTDLAAIHNELRAHAAVASASASAFTAFASEQRSEQRMLVAILRQICVNSAQTDTQRRECVQ